MNTHADRMRKNAINAITAYFHPDNDCAMAVNDQVIGGIPLDHLVQNCLELGPVTSYIYDDVVIADVREAIIRRHISDCIKNWIDRR